MEGWIQDLRCAGRQFARHPSFAAVAVLTLAVGIGANTAVFSAVRSVLLRPLPTPELDRVVVIRQNVPDLNLIGSEVSPPEVMDLAGRTEVFETVAGLRRVEWNVTGAGEPIRVAGAMTLGGFFEVFGVRAHLGRLYSPDNSLNGMDEVVVLSHGLWQLITGGDPSVIGTTIELDGVAREVVGVLPPGFEYPRGTRIYKPFSYTPAWRQRRGVFNMTALARLHPDVSSRQLTAALSAEAGRWNQQYHAGAIFGKSLFAVPIVTYLAGPLRLILLVLMGAVGLVLLIACANVASLQIVRVMARAREIAIRMAIGAGRGRIVRQLLLESALLATAAGILGLLFARFAVELLSRSSPAQQEPLGAIGLDGTVLAFTAVTSLVVVLAFGAIPALSASRVELQQALRDAGPGATADPSRHRLLTSNAVIQVALALVLLLASGLMIRSLSQLLDVNPGFRPDGVITGRVALPSSRYEDVVQQTEFYDRLLERLANIPGVETAGIAWALPFSDQLRDSGPLIIPARPSAPGDLLRHAEYRIASRSYFLTMGIPLLRGRLFDNRDRFGGPMAVIVDENFANQFFYGEDPVGQEIVHARGPATIVGVVGSVSHGELGEQGKPITYYHYRQTWTHEVAVTVRTGANPASMVGLLRTAVREIDPQLPLFDMATMEQRIQRSVGDRRLARGVLGAFAAVSLLLAVLGVYGVMRYNTDQRTREIGIRIALGAPRERVVAMVVRRGMTITLLGILAGLVSALTLTHLMSDMLYGVRARDPATFLMASMLLAAAGLVAAYLPARRAARVDPMIALRAD